MGKTYLFGGYVRFVNTDWVYVPSRKASKSRTFADLWQQWIDISGGNRPLAEVFRLWLCWNVEGTMSLNIACLNALMNLQDRVVDAHSSVTPNA